jgi:hypothetical protein
MSIVYRSDNTLGCTISVWDGTLTTEDMQQQLIRLASDPDWPPGPRHLVDGTTLGRVVVPDPSLLDLLYEGADLVAKMRIAVVVRPEFLDEVSARYHTATEALHAATFTDLDAACDYLDLDATAVHSVIDQLRQRLQGSSTSGKA